MEESRISSGFTTANKPARWQRLPNESGWGDSHDKFSQSVGVEVKAEENGEPERRLSLRKRTITKIIQTLMKKNLKLLKTSVENSETMRILIGSSETIKKSFTQLYNRFLTIDGKLRNLFKKKKKKTLTDRWNTYLSLS